MYDNFFGGSKLGSMGFYVNWFLHSNYSLRLANLRRYTHLIGSEPTNADRAERLKELDSTVAISDVAPSGRYTTPSDTTTTWNKGYVSYIDP